jgi:hypothetical protein
VAGVVVEPLGLFALPFGCEQISASNGSSENDEQPSQQPLPQNKIGSRFGCLSLH